MSNKKLLIYLPFLMMCFLIAALINWWFDLQDQNYMEQLLLHQKIDPAKIVEITLIANIAEKEEKYSITEWSKEVTEVINTYPANWIRVIHPAEEAPLSRQQIFIDLEGEQSIVIHLGADQVWIARSSPMHEPLRYILVEPDSFIHLFQNLLETRIQHNH